MPTVLLIWLHALSPASLKKVTCGWIEGFCMTLSKQTLKAEEWISWATYYASIMEPPATPPTSPNSHAMVWYGMKVPPLVISCKNPG
jgi:hypothetical protein